MRKHGWQLPYHPLQVVAVAVFLALGFAFYVFFAPFVGKELYQHIVMGVYTPLIVCVFGLYVWCAAADPADPGVFKSKKYVKTSGKGKDCKSVESKGGGDSASSICEPSAPVKGGRSTNLGGKSKDGNAEDTEPESEGEKTSLPCTSWFMGLLMLPCAFLCGCKSSWGESSDRHISEDGMFYCSLCEVEVFKYSKHCRVCDKCVDSFDHHCRWLNNCIGKRNYRKFFTLMIFSLLLLVLQWSTGILVLICCFLDRKRFSVDIVSKLGSSFTVVPFAIVVVVCTILAMLATLPIAQLFFFHILLIKKGISTYDYIIALREQEQQVAGGQQSPQMSQVSSLTGMSSASSFNTFHRGAWCTPPRLFVEDQYDVVPPETASVSSYGKKTTTEEPFKKKNPAVKISPWTLARLNAEEVSKAAAEARKKSKILQPITRREKGGGGAPRLQPHHQLPIPGQDTDSSLGSSGRRMTGMTKLGSSSGRKRNNNGGNNNNNKGMIRIPQEIGSHKLGPNGGSSRVLMGRSHGKNSNIGPNIPAQSCITTTSARFVPLQLESRSTFRSGLAVPMSSSANMMAGSSPESSLDSPDIHPFRVSSSGAEESRRLAGLGIGGTSSGALITRLPRSRSTSDGYEASGGEDSDRVPSAPVGGGGGAVAVNWDSLLSGSGSRDARIMGKVKTSSATGMRKH